METGADCSYTDSTNVYHENKCAEDTIFCCVNGDVKVCSSSTCGISVTPTLTTYAFWLILAGLAGFGVIILVITYVICRHRKPGHGSGHRKSVFGETISQTVQSRTGTRRSMARPSLPEFNVQSDHFRSEPRRPITVMSSKPALTSTENTQTEPRWTILNGFTARSHGNKRTDSREKILKSKESLPDVQG
ncbi:uncharacterized protein [Haliotis cracherodii]|uniref:uncharacterized protein n=1 Tax=Haliotis cracherodii TaxID=6455 RepID=UPI0039EB9F73